MNRLEPALQHYDRALAVRPDYAEAFNNRGNTLSRIGNHEAAIASFRHALRQIPDYVAAHNNLGSALHDAGLLQEAADSYRNAIRLKPDYAEAHNNLGNALLAVNKPGDALASFTTALRLNSGLTQAHYNMGNVLSSMGRYDVAVKHFSTAIQQAPEYAQAYVGLGNALNAQGLHRSAIECLTEVLRLRPDLAAAHNGLGNALSDVGRHEDSVASYRAALNIDPEFAEAHLNLGNALCEFGKYDEAVDSYNEALRLKPDFAEAHHNLSKNKVFTADDEQLKAMLQRIDNPDATDEELTYLCFALGKAFDDMGDAQRAFEYLQRGNRLRKSQTGYDIHDDRIQFDKITSLFNNASQPVIERADSGTRYQKQPIFIVGMPRSGTSLVEQILASHSQVHGGGELHTAGRLLSPLMQSLSANNEPEISSEILANLRDNYLQDIQALSNDEPWVTDKMPANFRWIGFLLAAIPEARIINLQRNPVATSWSIFRLLFDGNDFSNDLNDIAEYYLLYEDLMAFWHRRFPGRIFDLNYEQLTENQETETRRLLEFCDLPWESKVLEFHRTERAVRTHSDRQVRQKMYTGSSLAWQKYDAYLQPLVSRFDRKTDRNTNSTPSSQAH